MMCCRRVSHCRLRLMSTVRGEGSTLLCLKASGAKDDLKPTIPRRSAQCIRSRCLRTGLPKPSAAWRAADLLYSHPGCLAADARTLSVVGSIESVGIRLHHEAGDLLPWSSVVRGVLVGAG